jgi:hypothetical protein
LDNIWPQRGPSAVELKERFFKQKDMVEDHLGELVKLGKIDLTEAQKRIATDWTQFLEEAKQTCVRLVLLRLRRGVVADALGREIPVLKHLGGQRRVECPWGTFGIGQKKPVCGLTRLAVVRFGH